jgi:ribosome maturation factor RimP
MAATHDKERQLTREITPKVEGALPGTEVLAVELTSPERFTVYVDHVGGVDHALCERVTEVLRGYLDRYAVDVSSPGTKPPLRRRPHFERAVGSKVEVRTADEIAGKKRFRGELVGVGERTLQVAAGKEEPIEIPYDSIVRGNLIEEGAR